MQIDQNVLIFLLNSLPASGKFRRLLMIFANRLDLDQAPPKCRARSGFKAFDTLIMFLKVFFEKSWIQREKIMRNCPACNLELKDRFLFLIAYS